MPVHHSVNHSIKFAGTHLQCSSDISEPKYTRNTRQPNTRIRVLIYAHTRIDIRVYAYSYTHILVYTTYAHA